MSYKPETIQSFKMGKGITLWDSFGLGDDVKDIFDAGRKFLKEAGKFIGENKAIIQSVANWLFKK